MKRIYQYLLRNTAQAGSPYTLTLIYLSGFAPSQTLSQWNTQLGGNYTNLSVVGDNIILTGGSNVAFPNAALQGEAQLIEIQDDGSVISCGNFCFESSGLQNVSLSAVTTIGPNCFSNCLSLAQISLPACTDLGGTSGDDNVFSGITNNTIAAVFNTILSTNNSGQPDGDILDLYANNDVTTQWDTAPVNTVAPAITGTNSVGSVLTCSQGTWTYLGDITYTYQWRRGGSPIGGATASTYTLVTADGGNTVDCVVTATTSAGSTPQASSNSYAVPVALLLDSYTTNTAYAWSVARQLKNTATVAIRIRRSNDNAETDIGFSGGALDTAAITSFVGANSAFITKIYEQVGSGYDFAQTTAANQPRIVNAGTLQVLNTKPLAHNKSTNGTGMEIPSSTSYFNFLHNGTSSSVFVISPYNSPAFVFLTCKGGTGPGVHAQGSGSISRGVIRNASTVVSLVDGTTTITSGAQTLYSYIIDADNGTLANRWKTHINGGTAEGSNTFNAAVSASNSNNNLRIMSEDNSASSVSFQELIIFPSQPTLSTIRTNINNFYNIY